MEGSLRWQKSLKGSGPIRTKIQRPRASSTSDVINDREKKTRAGNLKSRRRLSVVDEVDDAVVKEKISKIQKAPKGTVTYELNVQDNLKTKKTLGITKPLLLKNEKGNLKIKVLLPQTLKISNEVLVSPREPIKSPIPLPSGVECIDPVEDNGLFEYWPEFIHYLKQEETKWIYTSDQIVSSDEKSTASYRNLLMNWLLEVTLHFKVSQETLYHTVRLVDTTLSKRQVHGTQLQLVGIACFFIASKLEEYYPPGAQDLLSLTDYSYTLEEFYKMEMRLLKLNNGWVYGAEPMIFLNRFIRAAFKEDDQKFRHTCMLFVDILIPSVDYSSQKPSLKAAAAVLASLMLFETGVESSKLWTPTLRYYTGYEEQELSIIEALFIKLRKLLIYAGARSSKKTSNLDGVAKKFQSRSRHGAILKELLSKREYVDEILSKL